MRSAKIAFLFIIPVLIGIEVIFSFCSNTVTKYIYADPDTIVFDTTGVEIGPGGTTAYQGHLISVIMPVTSITYSSNNDFSLFFNKAYASYKRSSPVIHLEDIRNIRIITLNDYNAQFPAGSDISDSCRYYVSYSSEGDSNNYVSPGLSSMTKNGVIQAMNNAGDEYYAPYNSDSYIAKRVSFSIKQPPAAAGTQRFAISFETSTPSIFGDTTYPFIIKP